MWEILGQILGVVAMVITLLSFQFNTKGAQLGALTAAALVSALGYLCLGAFSGFALNLVAMIRTLCLRQIKSGTKTSLAVAILFSLVMCGAGVFSWEGPVSLFIIYPMAQNTICMSFGRPQLLRKATVVSSALMIVYNAFVFSAGGIANELLAIASAVIGIIRFRKAKTSDSSNIANGT